MGQTLTSDNGSLDAKHKVEMVTLENLDESIFKHLKDSICEQSSTDIARKALDCLEERYETNFQTNCEILIVLQDVTKMSVTSGNGGCKVLILGDLIDCQAVILEYQISTSIITGLVLDSFLNFCVTMPVYLLRELKSKSFKNKRSMVKQFVQKNDSVDWKNATIDFHGIFPLKLTSGNGTNAFSFDQIRKRLEKSSQNERKHEQSLLEFTLEKFDARELSKIRLRLCGNEGASKNMDIQNLEKLFIALVDFFKQHEKEKYWNKSVIKIFNENDVLKLYSGTKTQGKEIIVMAKDGQPSVTVH